MTTNASHRSDTEWPRWEVFKQDAPDRPHQAVGSVHAVDPEHALLNARNVFVRRPSAISLWVAPAEAVFAKTQEELAENPNWYTAPAEGIAENYLVFRKTSHKRAMTFVDHVGEVAARSPEEALKKALETFTDATALAWWVAPEKSVTKSPLDEETLASWFEPAKDKTYKQQSEYGMIGMHPSQRKGAKREPRA
jgi:ring-1,2-phenylacetyl-CoA epoxidase subunit PaaB